MQNDGVIDANQVHCCNTQACFTSLINICQSHRKGIGKRAAFLSVQDDVQVQLDIKSSSRFSCCLETKCTVVMRYVTMAFHFL